MAADRTGVFALGQATGTAFAKRNRMARWRALADMACVALMWRAALTFAMAGLARGCEVALDEGRHRRQRLEDVGALRVAQLPLLPSPPLGPLACTFVITLPPSPFSPYTLSLL